MDLTVAVEIPVFPWKQIGGDMDPGAYGGTIAQADGVTIDLLKIQPVREYVGDKEARDVGFPFWTREACFDARDLSIEKDNVKSALASIGMDLETLVQDFTPTQRAIVIAEALLDYGCADDGPAGWSADIGIPEAVEWSYGQPRKVAGAEYLADEDDAFIRKVLLADLEIDHESKGPDEDSPESGLRVRTHGHTVEITEWSDIEAANGEEQPEGEKVLRQYAEVELDDLFAIGNGEAAKHRGTYSGDDKTIDLAKLARDLDDDAREKAIVAAAISWMGYYGGDESFVDEVGED